VARAKTERSMKGTAPAAILLILVGLLTVPFIKDSLGKLLLFAIFGGMLLIFVVFVIGGVILLAFRGSN
jgi:hypothetical protein